MGCQPAQHVAADNDVAGISLAITHRSEFATIPERDGVAGLIGAMRQKIDGRARDRTDQ